MRLLILYRPNSETARSIETFMRDFQRRHGDIGARLETLSVDTREGAATMSLYDLMQHPAILVLYDDGRVAGSWTGPTLPLMDEVAAYFYTAQQ